MSITSLAIRTAAFMALYGQTRAETRVWDSNLTPVDELRQETPLPFICLSVDEAEGEPDDRSLLSATDTLTLVVEIGLGQQITMTGRDGEGETEVINFPLTDQFQEAVLDVLAYQVAQVLSGPSAWATLYRSFVLQYRKVTQVRGGTTREGDKFAARQIVLEIHPLADPDVGLPVEDWPAADGGYGASPWPALVAALRAIEDPELAAVRKVGGLLSGVIGGLSVEAWARDAARLGLTADELAVAGFGPAVSGAGDVLAVDLQGVTIDQDRVDEVESATPPPLEPLG